MNNILFERLKLVFSLGKDTEPNTEMLEANQYKIRVSQFINESTSSLPLDARHCGNGKLSDMIIFIGKNAPDYDNWFGRMSWIEKTNWVKEHGKPYCLLFVKVSLVDDYYTIYFNCWNIEKDSERLGVVSLAAPNEKWALVQQTIKKLIENSGFIFANDELLREKVPFIETWGGNEIPDKDPRWDDNHFEPDPIPASIYDCLFGEY